MHATALDFQIQGKCKKSSLSTCLQHQNSQWSQQRWVLRVQCVCVLKKMLPGVPLKTWSGLLRRSGMVFFSLASLALYVLLFLGRFRLPKTLEHPYLWRGFRHEVCVCESWSVCCKRKRGRCGLTCLSRLQAYRHLTGRSIPSCLTEQQWYTVEGTSLPGLSSRWVHPLHLYTLLGCFDTLEMT